MSPRYWLIKSEPDAYPYSQLEKDRQTDWTGVRNFEARNNLRAMSPGDLALYYHSGEGKEIVGVAEIAGAPTADPTAPKEDWASILVKPRIALRRPVSLAEVKASAALKSFPLVTRSRLSVAAVAPEDFQRILALGKTTVGRRGPSSSRAPRHKR